MVLVLWNWICFLFVNFIFWGDFRILLVNSEYVHTITYTPARSCVASKYYDVAKLSCETCASGDQASYQVTDATGCSCTCKSGFRMVNRTNSGSVLCERCPPKQIASDDGRSCVSCDSANPFSNITEKCSSCSSEQIEVDRWLNGLLQDHQCTTCIPGTQPDKLGKKCIPCTDPLMIDKKSCECTPGSSEMVGGICFEKADLAEIPDQSSFYVVKYDTQEVESAYFCQNVRAAVAMCQIYSNATACQLLANLCALLYYRHAGETLNACSKYFKLALSGENTLQYPPNAPWLYYPSINVLDGTLRKKDVEATYSFNQNAMNSLNFTAASYTLDGKFLNLLPIDGTTWQLCPGPFNILNTAFKFGTRYKYKCSIPVKKLWDEYQTILYDPYLYYEVEGKQPVLYAVPVLVLNYVANGQAVNRGSPNQWQLVRRFYLVDNIIGKSPCQDPQAMASIVRFAKDVTITVQLYRSSGEASHIYPPLISIEYGEVTLEDYQADKEVKVSFSVIYEMDQSKEEKDFSIALGVLSSFAIIYSVMQTWSWTKRSGRFGIDLMTVAKLLLYMCGNLSTVFLTVTFFTCLYILVFFKCQDVVYVVLPTSDQEMAFVAFIVAAFFLKLIHLTHLLGSQVSCDIFFVDWERPRAKRTILHPAEAEAKGKECNEEAVSIWRTYLVANEWAELQTIRKTSLGFQILTAVFFLEVVGFENLASADPNSSFLSSSYENETQESITCRLAIEIAVYLVIAIVHWIFVSMIYEQFIEDKIKQFVDLCSISNISVFVMTMRQFGHYIHGRSVHGHADADMRTMHQQLRREEDNLCSQRGLLPNSDHQTFQMALPPQLRLYYDQVMSPLLQNTLTPAGRIPSEHTGTGNNTNLSVGVERSIQAYRTMNTFLASFLEHALRNLDYVVKDKLFIENVLDVEFQDPTDKGFFYEDSGHSYDAALLCGHEFTLIMFDLLLFTSIDLAAKNFILSGFITFVAGKVIMFLYQKLAHRNLARKTLVDSRFLI